MLAAAQMDVTEASLSQAVRLVLKYEVQTMLNHLSDKGEEYIVVAANVEHRTSDKWCSDKGEEYMALKSLADIEEEFLRFCVDPQDLQPQGAQFEVGSGTPSRRSSLLSAPESMEERIALSLLSSLCSSPVSDHSSPSAYPPRKDKSSTSTII